MTDTDATDHGLSPAALYVRYVLRRRGALSADELMAETGLPERTVRRAVRRLQDTGDVVAMARLGDARESLYAPA
jgi:hypothetical protein